MTGGTISAVRRNTKGGTGAVSLTDLPHIDVSKQSVMRCDIGTGACVRSFGERTAHALSTMAILFLIDDASIAGLFQNSQASETEDHVGVLLGRCAEQRVASAEW